MSRARHDKETKPEAYNAQGSEAEHEAEEMKHGGRKHRKRGGKMEHHEEHKVDGHHGRKRLDRPGRKRGGAVGADLHPLSTASRVHDAEDHKAEDGNAEPD